MDYISSTYYIIVGLAAFFSCFIITLLYISSLNKYKLIANPNERSLHKVSIPTGGGIIFSILHLVFLIIFVNKIQDSDIKNIIYKLCIGIILVIILGFVDDKYNIKARYKIFSQIFIAILMFFMGFKISQFTVPLGEPLELHIFSFPVTILWYLLLMNAINLIDGLDGLATGIAIITSLVLLFFSYNTGNFLIFINCAILLSTLSAFLYFNYHPARLFMGDTGSLFLGFIIASLAIAGNEKQFKGLATFTLLVPLTVIFVPICDTLFTIARRFLKKQYIFAADKGHVHHKLIEKGLAHQSVTLLCWFFTFVFGVLALGYIFIPKNIMLMLLLIIGIIMISLFFYIYKKELFK